MSSALTPEEALSRIPDWSDGNIVRQIHGGLTNRSFLVRSGEEHYVLRLDAEHTATFGLDRRIELAILHEASRAGIAPHVRFADPDAGILLYEYLRGPVWASAALSDRHKLERVARLLHRVHRLPSSGVALDTGAAAERYAAVAYRHCSLRRDAAYCVSIVHDTPLPATGCCCHNDIVADNIVGTSHLKLLDWEYACDNDPLFDLASLINYHDLDSERAHWLLDAYTGGVDHGSRERLGQQLRLFDALQWLWLAARQAVAPAPTQASRLSELRQRI